MATTVQMNEAGWEVFPDLPRRAAKPRAEGLTSVLDAGLSLAAVDGLLEVAGDAVDLVKLGWGTALVTQNLAAKLARYRERGIAVVLGGTLTELAIVHGRVPAFAAWLRQLGLRHVEVSDGTIDLPHADKLRLIEQLAADFTVLSEVGTKDDRALEPATWVRQVERELEAGATKVITEARASGTTGIYDADGAVRVELIERIADAVGSERLLFEAPRTQQQVWFVRRFGASVNLANICPANVVSLETIRLGLRADTLAQPARLT
ncbi:phosphosulfolactate synthase [Conexibacter sp. CPCC 206217]|uniref:phosphosulfolactate synthase n=1 Tax=Conexibacter sp. CPCC 206217 TaxID=3064574 RepID=UPI00271AA719|nr:phosphosulfolactate synthase [Conexibacter sp. CPCC 206217]MDO8212338.1 phosphosulfolactate synthase [Conexibacter sp. CPCC 206217]